MSLELDQLRQFDPLPPWGLWNYVLLALLVAIEGPIATLIGAAAASTGWLHPLSVYIAAMIGNTTADILWYLLGYLGKTEWLLQHGRWLGVRPEQIRQLERNMQAHARKILLVAKLTAGPMIPALLAAGLARVSWRRWFGVVFAAECLWTGGLVLAGYYLSESLKRLERGLQIMAMVGLIALLALLGGYLWRHRSVGQNPEE